MKTFTLSFYTGANEDVFAANIAKQQIKSFTYTAHDDIESVIDYIIGFRDEELEGKMLTICTDPEDNAILIYTYDTPEAGTLPTADVKVETTDSLISTCDFIRASFNGEFSYHTIKNSTIALTYANK